VDFWPSDPGTRKVIARGSFQSDVVNFYRFNEFGNSIAASRHRGIGKGEQRDCVVQLLPRVATECLYVLCRSRWPARGDWSKFPVARLNGWQVPGSPACRLGEVADDCAGTRRLFAESGGSVAGTPIAKPACGTLAAATPEFKKDLDGAGSVGSFNTHLGADRG